MDFRKLLLAGLLLFQFFFCNVNANSNLAFSVERKFKGPYNSLSDIKAHDSRRHGRFLTSVDFVLGGDALPAETGLYYTKLQLGSPPKDFHVQVDTGSDLLWVNCAGCTSCPKKSDIGIELNLFDPKASSTASMVTCDADFCTSTYDGPISGCKKDMPCPYRITYADGSTTTGSYVNDTLTFNQINGDLKTAPANSKVVFGCGAKQSGSFSSSTNDALDGIIGFGQANSSVLSQLAASGKVKKVFSHCFNMEGGGIFSIGEVVEPKVNTTALVPDMPHYNVILKDIEIDGDFLLLPIDIFDSTNGRGTIIDSGTTLAYLPPNIYDQIMSKVLARQTGLKLTIVQDQFTCFKYSDDLDKGFPTVKFHFEGISLLAHPHEYLFSYKDLWCIGWQKSEAQTKDGKDLLLLGDLVLSNKLVIYDVENMVIGWTDYNCSSTIKVKDTTSKAVYKVGFNNISSSSSVVIGKILTVFLLLIAMVNSSN